MNIINMDIIFLVISIVMFTGGILTSNSNIYTDAKDQIECNKKTMGKTCGIWWNDKECRKGKLDGVTCESDGTVFPLILIIVSVIFFLVSIGCFIKGFMLKTSQIININFILIV